MAKLTPEALYARLKELADSEPDLNQVSPGVSLWLGRLFHTLLQCGRGDDAYSVKSAGDRLGSILGETSKPIIRNALYRALTAVEGRLPEVAQGGFIAAGDVFDALAVMTTAVSTAQHRALFVDPYLSPEVLLKYAPMIPEGVQVDLLGGDKDIKPGLVPAAEAWIEQYREVRPLRIRTVNGRLLHDRMLIVDGSTVWDISQSLNALAARSHATISKSYPDHAVLKVEAYTPLFDDAKVLIEGP